MSTYQEAAKKVEIDWQGAGQYFAVSPDNQSSIDLGLCDTEEELRAAILETVSQGTNDHVWTGWTARQ